MIKEYLVGICSYNEGEKIKKWLSYGVKPTETVSTLLKKAEIIN